MKVNQFELTNLNDSTVITADVLTGVFTRRETFRVLITGVVIVMRNRFIIPGLITHIVGGVTVRWQSVCNPNIVINIRNVVYS